MRLHFMILFISIRIIISQNPTPCPEKFSYEPRNPKSDRWYGQIRYSSAKNTTGIWLHIILDRPTDLLGNWFGQITTSDNMVYDIRKPDFILPAGAILIVRFFVKFNLARTIPSVEMIKLNGNTICSIRRDRSELGSTSPIPHISQVQRTEFNDQDIQISPVTQKLVLSPPEDESNPESEFYPGDLAPPQALPRMGTPRLENTSKSSCGIVALGKSALTSQDGDTWPGKWPWHAALYRIKDTDLIYMCGATLITEQHVITPAHCVTKYHTKNVNQPNKFSVYLGKFNLNKFGSDIQNMVVSEIVVHPEYNHSIYINDIAVLKLSKQVRITNFVRPCCLWEENSNMNNGIGQKGTVVGWGFGENNKLTQAKMSVVPLENCFSQSLPDRNYCATFENGNACMVRSMGGMVFPRSGTSGPDTVWQIKGINVFSEIQAPCGETKYMVFTDVSKYIPWIKEVTVNDGSNS